MAFERIWFIGDTHFCHRNVIKYCGRPFDSIEKMNEILISNWNKAVKRDDRVFMLGDFALCGKDKIIEIGQKLNGRKILIKANHDGASLQTYYKAGFEIIIPYPFIYEDKYIISHTPIEDCYPYYNIHAHTHNTRKNDVWHFCTSVELINYAPINFEEIKNYFFNY